ncbi:phosphotransferase KptA/Tpt1 [Pseudovirgaria hyperparasitica]|uniref:2'-phosphotransferase n=1 Tax=Pseudovirgaria hyperparasitica TaxID=470096 RepID=A0A6A6W532_9PEZI|nr:phosphotransferase KptA/Tpt1 [Pseudovirgaria hyperparasitica]KAF2757982.1 phosphotransferase KptA/Tpt1 [Pseudovirgaria hyperparasitica]
MARGGRRGGREQSRDEQISRALSKLLRHNAHQEKLEVLGGGWIRLDMVLSSRPLKPLKITLPEIITQVTSSDKQRFALKPLDPASSSTSADQASTEPSAFAAAISPDADPADYLIRATQGHTIKFDLEDLITPITPENMPGLVVHGTDHRAWTQILTSGGLKPMGRNHVHFATGLPKGFTELHDDGTSAKDSQSDDTAPVVVSGMRTSSTVLVYLDLEKAMAAGVKFGISENGVVLSGGNEHGVVSVDFFQKVEDRKKNVLLMKDGVLVGEK